MSQIAINWRGEWDLLKMLTFKMKHACIMFTTILLLIFCTLPAWAVTYTYDDLNRLTKVTYGEGQEINFTYDAAGNMQSVNATGIDPLFTEILLEGTAGNSEWYKSDVKVSFTVHSGNGGGSGTTQYSFDGQTWLTYTAPFTVSSEGTTKIYYRSTSGQNTEPTKDKDVKIDKTPPVITGAATTQPNAKGWYNNDVTVIFTATDSSGSGIDTFTPDIVISTAGVDQTATGTATDVAGNTASVTVSGIKIDKESPTVNLFTR